MSDNSKQSAEKQVQALAKKKRPRSDPFAELINYGRYPHRFIEALCGVSGLTALQMKCALYIARMTLGFNRIEAPIALSTFEKATSGKRERVIEALRDLELMQVIRSPATKKRQTKIYGVRLEFLEFRQPEDATSPQDGDQGRADQEHISRGSSKLSDTITETGASQVDALRGMPNYMDED